MKNEQHLPFLHDSAFFCKKIQPIKLVLEIKNPGEWEALLFFLQQKGIDFRLTGKKEDTAATAKPPAAGSSANDVSAPKEKLDKDIEWVFSNYHFPFPEGTTFRREEIYEDADWEKNLH